MAMFVFVFSCSSLVISLFMVLGFIPCFVRVLLTFFVSLPPPLSLVSFLLLLLLFLLLLLLLFSLEHFLLESHSLPEIPVTLWKSNAQVW